MRFKSFGFSDVGRIRDHNEDNYLCDEEKNLFLVADGMGGHASGEVASQLAIHRMEEFIIRSRKDNALLAQVDRGDLTLEQNRLLAGAIYANRCIHETANQNPSMEGMGTTLIGVILEGNHLAGINVGDSRLYRIRNGLIRQISADHTIVGEQERAGILTKDEAKKHPQRHILTSALGVYEQPKIDVFLAEIQTEDLYLICSDGLHDMLDDNEILEIVSSIKDRSLYKTGLDLVLKANLAGGLDNITVVLISFQRE